MFKFDVFYADLSVTCYVTCFCYVVMFKPGIEDRWREEGLRTAACTGMKHVLSITQLSCLSLNCFL